uniref:Multicopper oxidase, type 2 n=1 Tax=Solibacter usitatus (strain Ellin6076) TaxID=234267 RepID=Q027S2_SOLUE
METARCTTLNFRAALLAIPMPLLRRNLLQAAGALAGTSLLSHTVGCKRPAEQTVLPAPDHTLTIAVKPVEIASRRTITTTTYNGQFPGPLLRFQEGRPITIDIHNQTDTPEQLHWHGQFLSSVVDGAAEEGTPYIPAHGSRRITFVPKPSGFRFYHTHVRAGNNLNAGQYTGLVGPVYIEPKNNPGNYDREVFLTLKEFDGSLSRGGDMEVDFLRPDTPVEALKIAGDSAMKASLESGAPHGYEVGYSAFTINGRMLGTGIPVRVKEGERILFHILNGSATEIRSLALPGHTFTVLAMDGNPIPRPVTVPGLWLAPSERISAIVEMNQPGVWVMGDLSDDDRGNGMGTVIEYAGRTGKPVWQTPKRFYWNYAQFGNPEAKLPAPDQIIDMTFAKQNAADGGFNRWTINGVAFSDEHMHPMFRVSQGRRYRLRMRNASDDTHPMHLHRHSFEVTRVAGQPTSGVIKDVVMLGGYQEMEIDFVADNPGLTLFHCHQQLHMDFGFMALIEYV